MATVQPTSCFTQYVSESDIDWLFCIELNSNPQFREWLGRLIFGASELIHDGAWRSISNSWGESDLVWRVGFPGGEHRLALIENKIDAVAQPGQAERYFRRGEEYRANNICSSFTAVLISPQGYTSKDAGSYEVRISYESIQEWFESQEDERSRFLASMFDAAKNRAKSVVPDPAMTSYRRKFWELARNEFPWLELREPGDVREFWVWQDYPAFTIVYKTYSSASSGGFYRSVVDLQLFGRASELEQFKQQFGAEIAALGGEIAIAGKSLAFRIDALCAHPPTFELSIARDALLKWDKVFKWWMEKSKQRSSVTGG